MNHRSKPENSCRSRAARSGLWRRWSRNIATDSADGLVTRLPFGGMGAKKLFIRNRLIGQDQPEAPRPGRPAEMNDVDRDALCCE